MTSKLSKLKIEPLSGAEVTFSQKRMALAGIIKTAAEADEVIEVITRLKPFLEEGCQP